MMKTSIKLKFRPSVKSEKEGTLYYQLIHGRRVKQINTHYKKTQMNGISRMLKLSYQLMIRKENIK